MVSPLMAKGTGWGYRRILGELKKLGIKCMSRSTISRIAAMANGDRGAGTWSPSGTITWGGISATPTISVIRENNHGLKMRSGSRYEGWAQ